MSKASGSTRGSGAGSSSSAYTQSIQPFVDYYNDMASRLGGDVQRIDRQDYVDATTKLNPKFDAKTEEGVMEIIERNSQSMISPSTFTANKTWLDEQIAQKGSVAAPISNAVDEELSHVNRQIDALIRRENYLANEYERVHPRSAGNFYRTKAQHALSERQDQLRARQQELKAFMNRVLQA